MRIIYIAQHGYAERVEIDNTERAYLTLKFIGAECGAVILQDTVYPLKDGEIKIEKSTISNGEHHPRLECESGVYAVEGFRKSGNEIIPIDTEDTVIRILLTRCRQLELTAATISERVDKLEKAIQGHNIFNFERKE